MIRSESMASNDPSELSELADRYATGRMPDAEREAFELRILSEPAVATEVELSQRMRGGLQELKERGDLASLSQVSARPATGWNRWAIAASLALIAAGLVYFTRQPDAQTPGFAAQLEGLRLPEGIIVSGPFVLAETRRPGDAVTIAVPPEAKAVRLDVLPPAADGAARYRVILTAPEGGEPLARFETSTLESGLIPVYLDASRFDAGRYRIVVEDLSTAGDASTRAEYPVTIERRD
jgi:hypothetical protein